MNKVIHKHISVLRRKTPFRRSVAFWLPVDANPYTYVSPEVNNQYLIDIMVGYHITELGSDFWWVLTDLNENKYLDNMKYSIEQHQFHEEEVVQYTVIKPVTLWYMSHGKQRVKRYKPGDILNTSDIV